jgi:hypothetical protein
LLQLANAWLADKSIEIENSTLAFFTIISLLFNI